MAKKRVVILVASILLFLGVYIGLNSNNEMFDREKHKSGASQLLPTVAPPDQDEPNSQTPPKYAKNPQLANADQCVTSLYFLSIPAKCISGDGRLITTGEPMGEFVLRANPPEP